MAVVQAHVGDRGGQRSLHNTCRRLRDVDMWVGVDMIMALDRPGGADPLEDITLELPTE